MQEALLQKAWRLEDQLSTGMFAIPIDAISPAYRNSKVARKYVPSMAMGWC